MRYAFRPVAWDDFVFLEPTEHAPAVEQREGIPRERIAAIYHVFASQTDEALRSFLCSRSARIRNPKYEIAMRLAVNADEFKALARLFC